jgi:hypothetical protein
LVLFIFKACVLTHLRKRGEHLKIFLPGAITHAYNPSTWEAEAGGL